MRAACRLMLLSCIVLLGQCQTAQMIQPGQELITKFWHAETAQEQTLIAEQLRSTAPDVATLVQWFKTGPEYSRDVPRGQLDLVRTDENGMEFPYVVLVPESYDSRNAYPVEFNLHGGVNREKMAPGRPWWRSGYEGFRDPGKIIVLPASWNEAYWWFQNQADNLPAILKSIKQTYHVDDNRVYLTGVSDGGTGSYFFAFFQPTEWAAFLPFIGNPGVLRNPAGRVTYPLYWQNLRGKPFYIVNGENDPLYPDRAIRPHLDAMQEAGAEFTYVMIPGGGHNTEWMPEEAPKISAFKQNNRRDPLPDNLQWTANRVDRYNRNHWVLINQREETGAPGQLQVRRDGNTIHVTASNTRTFTLLLSPDEINYHKPVQVMVNGHNVLNDIVEENADTLLKWVGRDKDRTMLFTAELSVQVPPGL